MGRVATRLCCEPYCDQIADDVGPGWRCEQHRKGRPRRDGPDRGYTSRSWRTLRDAYIAAHPTCQAIGCDAPARVVHHRDHQYPSDAGANVWSNCAALCVRCHRVITNHRDAIELEPPERDAA